MEEEKRNIGLLGAISIGVGGMVGGGIFAVLGEAVSLSHGATAISFLFAGIVALFTAYSYVKLSVVYQSSGGTISYIDEAFGNNLLSGSINFMLWLSYLVTISLYAVAFASYAQTFFDNKTFFTEHLFISIAIIFPMIINLFSSGLVSKSETVIVVIKVLLLFVVIVAGVSYVEPNRMALDTWTNTTSIFVAGMVIFVAYEGFELISNSSQDIKDPNKNLPRAFFITVIFVIVLYILIAIIAVGSVPYDTLVNAKDYALAIAAKPALGHIGFIIVSITALLATFSAINATIYGNARLSFILAKDGDLPSTLSKNNPERKGVLVTTFFSLILANSIDINSISIIASASFLLIFVLINISALKLVKEINGNKIIFMISIILSIISLCTLVFHTFSSNSKAILIFIIFVMVSILFEYLYGINIRKHFLKRPYKRS